MHTQVAPRERQREDRTLSEPVARMGKAVLLRYAPGRAKRFPVPLLIVTPLLVQPYILDLAPGLSFIDYLTEKGFDLFLLDFGTPEPSDRGRRLEDYLHEIDLAVGHTVAAAPAPSVTLLGYCLGGLFAVLYTASRPDRVKNLVALAAPFDFARGGALYRWLQGLDVDLLVDAFGNIPGEWIRDQIRLFSSRARPDLALRLWFNSLLRWWDPAHLQRRELLNRWLGDLRAFPAEAYRQFITEFVQRNALARGQLWLGGRRVDPAHIRCPVLVLAHAEDLLAPPESAKALLELVGSTDGEFVKVSGGCMGHVDIVIGDEGPAVTWPKVASWLGERSRNG